MITSPKAIKRLLIQAHGQYNQAVRDGNAAQASYWDGYTRAVRDALKEDPGGY